MGAGASVASYDQAVFHRMSAELRQEITAEYQRLQEEATANNTHEDIQNVLKEKYAMAFKQAECRHQFQCDEQAVYTCQYCDFICTHQYLNKWDGVYVCMDCFYNLSVEKDGERIRQEEEAEKKNTPSDVIPAGSSVGKMSQQRGVSIGFLLDFTKKYDCWHWNSWDVIRRIVKPATEKTRCRYVELPEMAQHVGPAKSFISYAQQGCWGDLVAGVSDGADRNRHVWIDIFAVRQWPSSTPDLDFASTIENCSSFIIICSSMREIESLKPNDFENRNVKALPDYVRKRIAFLRVWCLVEAHKAATMKGMPMIMKLGSHKLNSDESVSFVSNYNMLGALMVLVDIEQAEATVASDKERILSSIRDSIGIEKLNKVIRGVLGGAMLAAELTNAPQMQAAACGDSNAKELIWSDSDAMFASCSLGFANIVEELIKRGFDVNQRQGFRGTSPLMCASFSGHVEVMNVLLSHGAKINEGFQEPVTALVGSCLGGHTEAAKLLLDHGADVNEITTTGLSALLAACIVQHLELIQMILSNKANIHIKDTEGVPLLLSLASEGKSKVMELFFDHDNTLVNQLFDGSTLLISACSKGHLDTVKMLIERGADVNQKVDTGITPIAAAAAVGFNFDIVEFLLAKGAIFSSENFPADLSPFERNRILTNLYSSFPTLCNNQTI